MIAGWVNIPEYTRRSHQPDKYKGWVNITGMVGQHETERWVNMRRNIHSTLKNPSRFWNINHYSVDVDLLLATQQSDLTKQQDHQSRLESSIGSVFLETFDEKIFSEKLYDKLLTQFHSEEWEYAIVHGLKLMFPYYQIERVGGPSEKEHGTDILIRIPGILPNYGYAIAIQVKDYEGFVARDVIDQINKADKWNQENCKLIEKIVIITRANRNENLKLLEENSGVKFIFLTELKNLFTQIGKTFIGNDFKSTMINKD